MVFYKKYTSHHLMMESCKINLLLEGDVPPPTYEEGQTKIGEDTRSANIIESNNGKGTKRKNIKRATGNPHPLYGSLL